ncbi:hypothetical protein V6N12_040913 [Hibiscus sabdariffa]|uniref:Wall-associated receptor kinase 2-like n=1 Tax=Hibiscus sabdariffa TaxID=183260 RepID=A0ABR2E5R4_9ROSI
MLKELALLAVTLTLIATPPVAGQAKAGCQSSCGNISIPYPFGTGSADCYISDSFFIRCDTTSNPPKAFLTTTVTEVVHISVDGYLRLPRRVAHDCYNSSGRSSYSRPWLGLAKFTISNTRNKFTAIGCDTYAYVQGVRTDRYSTGCLTFCDATDNMRNGSCSGIGCCQTAIPNRVGSYRLLLSSNNNHSNVYGFNPCSYAFIVEDGAYNFSVSDLYGYNFRDKRFPVILDWTIGNQTCRQAQMDPQNYACKQHATCIDPGNGPGYLCKCLAGFQGNPYLSNANGCQDIDECETLKPCTGTATCHNAAGSYTCSCPQGFEGDGRKNGTGCVNPPSQSFPILAVALGIGFSLLSSVLCSSWVYLGLKRRKLGKLKQQNFQQNGGILLRQQLSKREEYGETAKIFTLEELKKATNNYHESRILGRGGQGTVYKGILSDGHSVAIKKSIIGDQSQVQQFINEVIVLSQINHRNVVKLLGCCLETRVPLLVYEYVRNGTLFHHLHNAALSWEARLKIATQAAEALSYLHSSASPPVIHRDVKLTNILLDDNYNAKVWKLFLLKDPSLRGICVYFVSVMKEGRLAEIFYGRMPNDNNIEQLMEVAAIARRCVKLKGEERPTMKEVACELQGSRAMEKHLWGKGNLHEETKLLLDAYDSGIDYDGSSTISMGPDSMKNQVPLEIYGAR